MTTPSAFQRDKLLSSGDIAKKLGVHRTTVWHWMQGGMLRYVQVTPRFRGVREEDLKSFQANFVGTVSRSKKSSSKTKSAKKAVKKKPKRKLG